MQTGLSHWIQLWVSCACSRLPQSEVFLQVLQIPSHANTWEQQSFSYLRLSDDRVGINLSWVRVLVVACFSSWHFAFMVERIKQPPVFNLIMRGVLLEHPGWGSCVPQVLCCVTLGKGWEVLGWDGTSKMGLHSVPTGVIRQWPGQGRQLFVPAVFTGSCWYNPDLFALSQHRDSCPAPGCSTGRLGLGLSGFQAQSLKCGKVWKTGQRVRQGIVIFLKMLRELECASDCDSGDVKI